MMPTQRGNNASRSESARKKVLASALDSIRVNGYHGSSLAAIADDAGLTKAGLLHHFPSKEHLLVAVLEERDRLDGARFQLADVRGLEALTRLVQLVEHNVRTPGLVQAFTVLMGESTADGHPAREWFQQRYPRRRANIARAMRAGIEDGEIQAEVDCDALAAEILAVMDGLQIQWVLDSQSMDMLGVFAGYIDRIRRSIQGATGAATS